MSVPALWTVDDMAAAMGAERQGTLPATISGLSIDTRTIGEGEAFFALADRRDGHEFVPTALAAKAALAVSPPSGVPTCQRMHRFLSCPTFSPRCAGSPPRRGRARTPR